MGYLSQIIRKQLKEAVGVPNNIVNVGNDVYPQIINKIEDDATLQDIEQIEYNIKGKYEIGDVWFDNIIVSFKFKPHSEFVIVGMGINSQGKLTGDNKIKNTTEIPDIQIVVAVPPSTTGKELKDFLISNKQEIRTSLTHELKHYYDAIKKPESTIKYSTEYSVATSRSFMDIEPLNVFLYNLYFAHAAENLVRSSEIAADMDELGVTQKQFYDFIVKHRVFVKLKEIKEFTYEGLRKELHNFIPQIKEFLEKVLASKGFRADQFTPDELIDKTLELFIINMNNWKAEDFKNKLISSMEEYFLGFSGDKDKMYNEYINGLEKYNKDKGYVDYFKDEEKIFHVVADKMIRKISKLYSLLGKTQNESIINWELHLKYLEKPTYKDHIDYLKK